MSCRDMILESARRLTSRRADGVFDLSEVVSDLRERGCPYTESTIRTHVSSRMCADAPDNHAVTHDDFERIGRGQYRLCRSGPAHPAGQ